MTTVVPQRLCVFKAESSSPYRTVLHTGADDSEAHVQTQLITGIILSFWASWLGVGENGGSPCSAFDYFNFGNACLSVLLLIKRNVKLGGSGRERSCGRFAVLRMFDVR